jgi:endonuclease/exonuclease/phosphatase family metal-dependent hydrolase
MKLISLNIWGGEAGIHVLDWFRKNQDVDFFLLQEVYHHATEKTDWLGKGRRELFAEINDALPDHEGYFAASESAEWGLASFIRKSVSIDEMGDVFVHRWKDALKERDAATLGKNIQYFKINSNGKSFGIVNFHGLWNGKGKTDTDERLEQSRKVKKFLGCLQIKKVLLCGDFNLIPDTKSLAVLEDGMRNLIKETGVMSTRSNLYKKEIKFADYILVSPEVQIENFRVMQDVVSDHLPLLVEFD